MLPRASCVVVLSGLALATTPALAEKPPPRSAVAPVGPVAVPARRPTKPARAARVTKKAQRTGPVATLPGFAMRPDGTSVVFVSLTSAPQVEEHLGKGFVTYVLKDTEVDRSNNKNPLETAFYDTPVLRAQLRTAKKDPDAELAIELRADVKPTFKVVTEAGQARLEILFPAGKYARADLDPDPSPQGRRSEGTKRERPEKKRKGPSAKPPATVDDGRKGPKAP